MLTRPADRPSAVADQGLVEAKPLHTVRRAWNWGEVRGAEPPILQHLAGELLLLVVHQYPAGLCDKRYNIDDRYAHRVALGCAGMRATDLFKSGDAVKRST